MGKLLIILAALLGCSSAVWIGEQYWTSINHDGAIRQGRSREDFLTFGALHQRQQIQNAYIAFWITNDQQGHYEAFGQAWVEDDGRVCGRFVGRYRNIENICGGFRVLSRHEFTRANPFRFVRVSEANIRQSVTYRRRQIAKITSWQKNEAFYGGVSLNDQVASGIDYDLEVVEVGKRRDPAYYDQFVEVLIKEDRQEPQVQPPPPRNNEEHYYHSDHVTVKLRDDVYDFSYEPQRHEKDKQRYLHRPSEEVRMVLSEQERQRLEYNAKLKEEEKRRAAEKERLFALWEARNRQREEEIKKQAAGVQVIRDHENALLRRFNELGHW